VFSGGLGCLWLSPPVASPLMQALCSGVSPCPLPTWGVSVSPPVRVSTYADLAFCSASPLIQALRWFRVSSYWLVRAPGRVVLLVLLRLGLFSLVVKD
jgi:hypothetical protein